MPNIGSNETDYNNKNEKHSGCILKNWTWAYDLQELNYLQFQSHDTTASGHDMVLLLKFLAMVSMVAKIPMNDNQSPSAANPITNSSWAWTVFPNMF